MANAFGQTFSWAVGLLLVALVFSSVLPKHRPALKTDALPLAAP